MEISGYKLSCIRKKEDVQIRKHLMNLTALNWDYSGQWESNLKDSWYSPNAKEGFRRLYSHKMSDDRNLWTVGRLLCQKMPAAQFEAVTIMKN